MKKRFIASVLVLAIVLTALTSLTFATGETETTPTDPEVIEIYDWEDLKELDARVEGGDMLEGVTVKLMNDIDLYEMGTDSEPVSFNPIGANQAYFKGTFDGQGHTIKNMYQSGWALGYDWYTYGTIGLFAYLWNATVKNLTIENAECFVEGGNVAGIAGCAWGDCTFENITITNSTYATYNNRAAGIVGYTGGEGTMTFKDITVDGDTVIAGLWGSFDSSLGGVIGSIQDPTNHVFENVTVECRLDAYNDVTAAYKYYAYRMCGMLIGKIPVDANNQPILDKVTIVHNVTIDYSNTPDYSYTNASGSWQRVEAGYAYDGVDLTQYPDAEVIYKPANSMFGGQQYGSYGQDDHEDIVAEGRVAAFDGEYFTSLETAIKAADGATDSEGNAIPVKLMADYSDDIVITESLKLDMNDYSFTGNVTTVDGYEVVFEDGKYTAVKKVIVLTGSGTKTDPYLITNLEELKAFRDYVNEGNTYADKYIKLTADIDLSNEIWIPIGTSNYDKTPTTEGVKMFAGNFDGGNHTITGLTSDGYIPDSAETGSTEYSFGLFGYVYGANISNVKLADVDINCGTRADSAGNNRAGSGIAALIGYYVPANEKTSVIENCHVLSGTIKASNNMGGLIGHMDSQLSQPAVDITISNCSNAADVTTEAREAGGILGLLNGSREGNDYVVMRGSITFKDCSNTGAITTLAGGGSTCAGGILGRDNAAFTGQRLKVIFDNCTNSGTITVYASGETHVAGLGTAFYSNGSWLVVKDSKNTGAIAVNNANNETYAGELVAYAGVVDLINSTATGTSTGVNKFVGDVQSILFVDDHTDYVGTITGNTYYLNGGTSPEYAALVDDAAGGGNFHLVETAYRDNAEFGGWYDNSAYTGSAYTALNSNVKTYYAKWNVNYVAKVNGAGYETLQAAVNAANNDDVIKVLMDHKMVWDGVTKIDNSYAAMVCVAGKSVTIDLNGKKLTGVGENNLFAAFAADEGGSLTLTDSSVDKTGSVEFTGSSYCLLMGYEAGTKLIVDGGSYKLEKASDSLIYSGGASNIVTVNGGTFELGNVGNGSNGKPWIFNAYGNNNNHVTVSGGTYNFNIAQQYWAHEVDIKDANDTLMAVKDNGDGTWTVVPAVVYTVKKVGNYDYQIGYATLVDAVNASNGDTVYLLGDLNVENSVTIGYSAAKVVTIDLNKHTLSGNGVTLIAFRGGTEVTLKNGTVHGNSTGGTLVTTYNGKLILGDDLNVTSGGQATAIKVKGGKLEVPGKNVTVTGGKDCIALGSEVDAENITISGGTYSAEIPEAWCIDDYGSVQNSDGTWTVQRVKFILNETTGEKFATLADAIKAIAKGADVQTLKLLDNTTAKGQFIGHSYAQKVVLDLNGFTLSSTDKTLTVYRSGTEVTIQNGTVSGNTTGGTIQVTYGGKLTLGENVTVKSGGSANAIKVDTNSTLIVDKDSTYVLGGKADLIVADGAKVEVSDGSFKKPVADAWCAEGYMPAPDKTAEGYYTVMEAVDAMIVGGDYYDTLKEAIAAAQNDDTIKIMRDINVTAADLVELDGYNTFFNVNGKSLTIDLNGHNLLGYTRGAEKMVIGMFVTDNNGHLTLKDSVGDALVRITSQNANVYALITNYEDGCSITIENGTYELDKASDSLIYSAANANEGEGSTGVIVNGGIFKLGNVGKNGKAGNYGPWIFNARGQNQRHIWVTGGTFDADVNHQYWVFEVQLPRNLAVKANNDGTWTVVDANYYVTESHGNYIKEVGFATLEDAQAALNGEYRSQVYHKSPNVKEKLFNMNGTEITPTTDPTTPAANA